MSQADLLIRLVERAGIVERPDRPAPTKAVIRGTARRLDRPQVNPIPKGKT